MRRTCAHHPQPWEFRTQELQFCSRQHASKRLCCTWLVRRGVKSSGMTMGETRRAEGGMEAVVGTVMVTVVMVWELVYWLDCVGVGCHPRGDQGCEGRPRETRVGETKLGVADQLACAEQRVPRSWHAARRLNYNRLHLSDSGQGSLSPIHSTTRASSMDPPALWTVAAMLHLTIHTLHAKELTPGWVSENSMLAVASRASTRNR